MTEATLKPGWTKVKFGEVVRLCKDRSSDPEADGIERYVGLEHLEPEDLRIRRWGLVADGTTFTSRFKPGQVLFGKRRAYQRKVAVADFEGICSGDIYVFESADPKRLLPGLLKFICQTDHFFEYAIGTSAGSLSPRTNWKSLKNFDLLLPSIEKQSHLLQVALCVRKNLEASKDAILASQNLINSWIQKKLENFSKDYPIKKAVDVLDTLTVGIVVRPADWYVEPPNGVPALRSLNVFPHELRLDEDELVYISEEGHSQHSKSQLNAGDIVVVRTGRPGDAAVVPNSFERLNCIDLIIAKPTSDLLPDYFVAVLNSPFGRRQFNQGIAGTAQKHFNVGAFKKLLIPIPPEDIQESFIEEYNLLADAHKSLIARVDQNKRLYTETLQELFITGGR